MWTIAKYFLMGLAALVGLAIIGFVLMMYFMGKNAKQNAAIIDQLCSIPPGTAVEEVLPMARRLGIREEGQSALGKAIHIVSDDPNVSVNEADDSLPGFTNGKITLGKTVIFPFERHYCTVTIENRKVVATSKRILD